MSDASADFRSNPVLGCSARRDHELDLPAVTAHETSRQVYGDPTEINCALAIEYISGAGVGDGCAPVRANVRDRLTTSAIRRLTLVRNRSK